MKASAKKLIGDYTKHFSGQAGVKTVSVLRGFVFPKMLPPAVYGIWRLILVLWQYGRYIHPRTDAIIFGGQRSPLFIYMLRIGWHLFWHGILTVKNAFCTLHPALEL